MDGIANPKPDAELVAMTRDGDLHALAELLERYRRPILAMSSRMLGRTDLAEDAFQEAALRTLLGLDHLKDPARFGPWFAGIAINVCRGWVRSSVRERFASRQRLDDGLTNDPVAAAEQADVHRRVRQAVAELPAGQREAAILFYLSGMTQQEVADEVCIRVGAVKTRLHKARAKLRQRLSMELEVNEAMAQSMVGVRVAEVARYADQGGGEPAHVVVLKEITGSRSLPIWIGRFEATAIAIRLEGIDLPRPDTYTFLAAVLEAAGARLAEVRIHRLADEVFYAEVVVQTPTATSTVDTRPSDALNAALLTGAPIKVASEVIEAGLHMRLQPMKPDATAQDLAKEASIKLAWRPKA